MPRGKPFIFWLDYGGVKNDVPLYVGDEVYVKDKNVWKRGKIGYKGDWLVVRCGKKIVHVYMRTQLRAINKAD